MELLYYWIESGTNFKNAGFRLSSRYNVEFYFKEEASVLKLDKNDNYLPNFFGHHISGLTTIVGENGAGKTNFLYSIISKLTNYGFDNAPNYLLIIQRKDLVLIFDSISGAEKKTTLQIQTTLPHEVIKIKPNRNIFGDPLRKPLRPLNAQVIYFNPAYDFRDYPYQVERRNFVDISSTFLLWNDEQNKTKGEFDMAAIHRSQEVLRQFNLINSPFLNGVAEIGEIKIPNEIQVQVFESGKIDSKGTDGAVVRLFDAFRHIASDVIGQQEGKLRQSSKSNSSDYQIRLKSKVKVWLLTDFFDYFYYCYAGLKDSTGSYLGITLKDIDSLSYLEQNDGPSRFSYPKLSADEYRELIFYFFSKQRWIPKSDFDFRLELTTLLDLIDSDATILEDRDTLLAFPLDPAKNFLAVCDRFARVFKNRYRTSLVRVQWRNMSSGEVNFLNLFSRIYYAVDEAKKRSSEVGETLKFVYLMLDEGDLGFHPHWQKSFIYTLVQYLRLFNGLEFQVFLTSHSPVMLSDVPKSNVIFLEKSEEGTIIISGIQQQQTFGSNIHLLLRDTFFMKDGVIGKFASRKISDLAEVVESVNVNTIQSDVDTLIRQVDIIGEPILRNALMEKLQSKLSDNAALRYHEEEIEKIRARQSKNR